MQKKHKVEAAETPPIALVPLSDSRIDKLISQTTIHVDLAKCISAAFIGIAIIITAVNTTQGAKNTKSAVDAILVKKDATIETHPPP